MELKELSPEQAAAELYLRSLKRMGTIDTAWRKTDSNAVCATTHGDGPHMMNQAQDFDVDVHLICETEEVRDAGKLPESIPDDAHGGIFFNAVVHGVADDATGYALPTHAPKRDGAVLRGDIEEDLRHLAETVGVPLEPDDD